MSQIWVVFTAYTMELGQGARARAHPCWAVDPPLPPLELILSYIKEDMSSCANGERERERERERDIKN
jgi:hypothetical protein